MRRTVTITVLYEDNGDTHVSYLADPAIAEEEVSEITVIRACLVAINAYAGALGQLAGTVRALVDKSAKKK